MKLSVMNTNNNQIQNSEAQCCVDYCRTTYNVAGQEVVNNHKCNQQTFSTSDLWRLRRNRREFTINTSITIH